MSKNKKPNYNADSIDWYQGLEAIRQRTSLYVSDLDDRGVGALAKEIISNAMDEANNGHAKTVTVIFGKDGSVTVSDDGRGIPIGKHKKDPKRDVLHILLTETHSGGKMRDDGDSYEEAVGTYGVGLAVVTALSEYVDVFTFHDKKSWHTLRLENGDPASSNGKPKKLAAAPAVAKECGVKKGTIVRFKPDLKFFDKKAALPVQALIEWIGGSALFCPATIIVHKPNNAVVKFEPRTLGEQVGIVRESLKGEPMTVGDDEPIEIPAFEFSHVGKSVKGRVRGAIVWSSLTDAHLSSYVSGAATVDGGTHVKGFESALKTAFEAHRKRGDTWNLASLMSGMVGILNTSVPNVRFNGQAKTKLTSPQATKLVEEALLESGKASLVAWLKANKKAARAILDRANSLAALTQSFIANKKLAAAVNTTGRGKVNMPKLLKESTTKNDAERELYIVEGKSAAGGAIEARDPRYQEILALTGKPENVWRSKAGEAMSSTNPRIIDVLKSIGYNPKFPGKFRIGKVIILTDADSDGQHISALLLGILQKIAPELFTQGCIFRVDDSLFIYRTETQTYRAKSLKELQALVPGKFNSDKVTRLKGLGEVPAEILKEMALNPATRVLIPITGVASTGGLADLVGMLGDDVAARKKLLNISC